MAFALVSNVKGRSGGDASTFTTGSADTTGADLLVIHAGDDSNSGNVALLSDSKSNTWTQAVTTGPPRRDCIYYAWNPTVGTGHTFTLATPAAPGTHVFGTIQMYAFSGAQTSSDPLDDTASNTSTGPVTTFQPGSVTPTTNDQLVFSGVQQWISAGTPTINSSFTSPAGSGTGYGDLIGDYSANATFSAYLIQTTAASVNPTWSNPDFNNTGATIATFKAAAGGGGTDGTATPAVIARSVVLSAPTPQAGTVKSAPLIARTVTVPAPTPQVSKTVAPALIARTTAMPAPTPLAGSTVTPAVIARSVSVLTAAASGGGSGTAVPTVIPLAATIPTPAASGASGATAAPTVIPLTLTLPTPTAQAGATTTPTVIPLTVTIPQASATGASQGTATPAVITTLVTMPAPTNVYGSTATPTRIQLAVTMPQVAASGSRTVTPTVTPLTVNVRTASASGGTQGTALPNVIATVTVIPSPTNVYGYIANPQAIALAVSIGAVLASGIVPDANPITVTLRDRGHTITVRTTGTTTTAREN